MAGLAHHRLSAQQTQGPCWPEECCCQSGRLGQSHYLHLCTCCCCCCFRLFVCLGLFVFFKSFLADQRSTIHCPRRLTFSWWGCYNLRHRHKITKFAHSFFYSVLVSISVFMAFSTLFHSINSPDKFSLCHSVLLVLILPYWSFQLYFSLWKSPPALI